LTHSDHDPHAGAVRAMVRSLAGDVDTAGVELIRLVRIVSNQFDAVVDEQLGQIGLSGPRWTLLMRLMAEERRSNGQGASPTHLSRCQNVSKNTISALLRGLEEQGFVRRTLDPEDRRVFRIHLTDAGQELIQATAPENVRYFNHLVSGLSAAERSQLIELLVKLHSSMAVHCHLGGESRDIVSSSES
jgi:DNA-binding MarR family transcriptional regulator